MSWYQALPGLREEVGAIIEESTKKLDIEETEDNQLRDKHDNKWTRTKSVDLNGATRNEATKLHAVLTNAGQSDGTLNAQFEANRGTILVTRAGRQ